MKIRDRIKELRRVPAADLLPNPKNWRTHPKAQQDAMRGVLADIGYAGAALARETDDGLMLIDGHLRAEVSTEAEIPVLILDVTEEEADKILATFDPISAMAGTDEDALRGLLDAVNIDNAAVNDMLDAMAAELPQAEVEIVEDEVPEVPDDPITQPGDLWLLGAFYECEDCGKKFDYDKGRKMEVCPCE